MTTSSYHIDISLQNELPIHNKTIKKKNRNIFDIKEKGKFGLNHSSEQKSERHAPF